MRLHTAGWDTDDIDAACEALVEACEEGDGYGLELSDLSAAEVEDILDVEIDPDVVPALLALADLLARRNGETQALRDALYDIDAFAYDYGEDE